jgi:hypothetical protein
VIVEQQVPRVLALASWAVVLDHGRVAYEGDPAGARRAVEALTPRPGPTPRRPGRPGAGGSSG